VDIAVDRELCIGAGQCVLSLPRVFDQNDDGLVVVRGVPGRADGDAVREAVDRCPSHAIRIDDD
jgi:ferredoxin